MVLTIFSVFLMRGAVGLIIFAFFVIASIIAIVLDDIGDGIFYGSIILAFLVIVNAFKQYSGPD